MPEMSVLVVGSIALDSLETPFGKRKDILGGSAVNFSASAAHFTRVSIVGVAGKDFPLEYIRLLRSKGIDTGGIEIKPGETFRWKGKYGQDLNTAHTIYTKLNVFREFVPNIPEAYRKIPFIFLANIDPNLQRLVLKKMSGPKLVACDSMNFWIKNSPVALKKLLGKADIFFVNDSEIRLLSGEANLIKAAKFVFSLGPERVIIKRGDSGALLISRKGEIFSAPAYLMETIKDPTGAGDAFAGGFMGYLSKTGELNEEGFRRAVVYGTIMASFCVQDFGPKRLFEINSSDVKKRLGLYERMSRA